MTNSANSLLSGIYQHPILFYLFFGKFCFICFKNCKFLINFPKKLEFCVICYTSSISSRNFPDLSVLKWLVLQILFHCSSLCYLVDSASTGLTVFLFPKNPLLLEFTAGWYHQQLQSVIISKFSVDCYSIRSSPLACSEELDHPTSRLLTGLNNSHLLSSKTNRSLNCTYITVDVQCSTFD